MERDSPQSWLRPTGQSTPRLQSRALRLLHYSPRSDRAGDRDFGAGAHSDWGALTILAQDDVGSLEVLDKRGTWIDVPPRDGAFVVNVGDLLALWTNDRYTSTMHRVRGVPDLRPDHAWRSPAGALSSIDDCRERRLIRLTTDVGQSSNRSVLEKIRGVVRGPLRAVPVAEPVTVIRVGTEPWSGWSVRKRLFPG